MKRSLGTIIKIDILLTIIIFFSVGTRNGACVLIEKALGRKLLYLPCRHHVFEIVLRNVLEVYWPVSSSPNVPIYQRFKKTWDEINPLSFTAGICDQKVLEVITPIKEEILKFIDNQLKVNFFLFSVLKLLTDYKVQQKNV